MLLRIHTGLLGLLNCDYFWWYAIGVQYAHVGGSCVDGYISGFVLLALSVDALGKNWYIGAYIIL